MGAAGPGGGGASISHDSGRDHPSIIELDIYIANRMLSCPPQLLGEFRVVPRPLHRQAQWSKMKQAGKNNGTGTVTPGVITTRIITLKQTNYYSSAQ